MDFYDQHWSFVMRFAVIILAIASLGAPAQAQFLDLHSLMPTLSFPEGSPVDDAVPQDRRIIRN